MKTTFHDIQDESNPLNGSTLQRETDVSGLFDSLLKSLKNRQPFSCEIRGDNGYMLTIGVSVDVGCAQYGSSDGTPPYWMAVGSDRDEDEFVEFLAGDTHTPMPRRNCLPMAMIQAVTADFVTSGQRSRAVEWEEV